MSNDRETNTPSRVITEKQAVMMFQATGISFLDRMPFNRSVTVHLSHADHPHLARSLFFKRFGDWMLKTAGLPASWLYVLENSNSEKLPGLHVHALMHAPHYLLPRFDKLISDWVLQAGIPDDDGVLHSQPVFWSEPNDPLDKYLAEGLLGSLRYLLKGIDPDVAKRFGIRPEPQGVVARKRCGISRALSPESFAARPLTEWQHHHYRILKTVWGDQSSGEYRPGDHVPLPPRMYEDEVETAA